MRFDFFCTEKKEFRKPLLNRSIPFLVIGIFSFRIFVNVLVSRTYRLYKSKKDIVSHILS